MEKFIIDNPRWDVVGKYLDTAYLRWLIEEQPMPGWGHSTVGNLNNIVESTREVINEILADFDLIDDPYISCDLSLVQLVITFNSSNLTILQDKMGESDDSRVIDSFCNRFGEIAEVVEEFNKAFDTVDLGFRFKIVSDIPRKYNQKKKDNEHKKDKENNDDSRIKKYNTKFELSLPLSVNGQFWKVLHYLHKSTTLLQPIYADPELQIKGIRNKEIRGFYNYLFTEHNLNQYNCARLISKLTKKIDLPIGQISTDSVIKLIVRS